MKILSTTLMILGTLFLIVGIVFYYFNWPDLWHGLITGPIVIALGLILNTLSSKILKQK